MTTILVTGSEGNIGSYIVAKLKQFHPDCTVLRVKHNVVDCKYIFEKNLYIGDLLDSKFLKMIFDSHEVEYIIHSASQSYSVESYANAPYDICANELSMLTKLLQFSHSIKKFVYLSSASVYEHAQNSPFVEAELSTTIPPSSCYGIAKLTGEKLLQFYSEQYDLNYTIWRLFNVVSPLEPHVGEGRHVFVDFYRELIVEKTRTLKIFGSGEQIRCFTWVEDVAECIACFIENTATDRQVFNAARVEAKTLIDLKDALLMIGRAEGLIDNDYNPDIVFGRSFTGVDSAKRIPDVSKLQLRLGWECQTDFISCFTKFVQIKAYQ